MKKYCRFFAKSEKHISVMGFLRDELKQKKEGIKRRKAVYNVKDMEYKLTEDNSLMPGVTVEKDGVHFGVYAGERPVLLLYKKGTQEVAEELPFPEETIPGAPYTMKVKLPAVQYEYNFRIGEEVITDPYAKRIVGREVFGAQMEKSPHSMRGAFLTRSYKWENDKLPQIPYDEAIMYHLHVRGFTMQKNSGVRKKGTFSGVKEKIPYLKSLGINQVKLMPVYEFSEMVQLYKDTIPGAQRKKNLSAKARQQIEQAAKQESYKLNFWGYGEAYYFAPKAAYAAGKNPDEELKDLVKALHAEGIEVILDFAFPEEMDFGMICDCLSYWAYEYHIDGFSVIGRDSLKEELTQLPLFGTRKLISVWYPDHIVNRNWNGKQHLLAAANDGFMNDCRKLLRGDEYAIDSFSNRLRQNPAGCASVNYITNHDGFTLLDLVSFNEKHNEENGEMGRDGSDYNISWNCGIEGPSKKRDITNLRMRQRKNAYAMLLFSQGTPMLLAGDEIGNSQNGNNNPYCLDNETSWTDWGHSKGNQELADFVKSAIVFRKAHKVLHQKTELKCSDTRSCGFPDLSFHGDKAWYGAFEQTRRHLGTMFSGQYAGEKGFLYIAWNFHWNEQEFALPFLPKKSAWYKVMDTSLKESFIPESEQECLEEVKSFKVPGRTVVILEGRETAVKKDAGGKTALGKR